MTRLRGLRDGRLVALALPYVALLESLAAVALLHLPFFDPPVAVNHMDEGYINAFSMRMLEGSWLPYVDAVSHRGPVLYWLAAIAAALGDPFSFVPIRVLALVCSMLIVALTFATAVRMKRPLAGATASLGIVVALLFAMGGKDGIGYNGELVLGVFATGAALCSAHALAPDRETPDLRLVGLAGALVALGVLCKQVGIVLLVPFALWALVAGLVRGPRPLAPFLALTLGAVMPVAVVLSVYAASGHLDDFWFYYVTYNSDYYMAPFSPREVVDAWRKYASGNALYLSAALVFVSAAAARVAARARRGSVLKALDENALLVFTALAALVTGVVANVTLRGFHHYFVVLVPWFALLAGLLVDRLATPEETRGWRRVSVAALLLGPAMWFVGFNTQVRQAEYRKAMKSVPPVPKFCEPILEKSAERAPIYVWGFGADIYTFCKRRPASRYVYSTFISGFIPFIARSKAEEASRVVPGSQEIFLEEMEATKPELIVDAAFTMGDRRMNGIPLFKRYLEERYCVFGAFDELILHVRRKPDGSCPAKE